MNHSLRYLPRIRRAMMLGIALPFASIQSASASDSFTLLSYQDKPNCILFGVSPDGSRMFGGVTLQPLPATFDGEWHLITAPRPLGKYLTAISTDNSTLLGSGGNFFPYHAWYMRDNTITPLSVPVTGAATKALACSADGNIILGSVTTRNGTLPYLWINNVPTLLPQPNSFTPSPVGMSDDGRIVIGNSGSLLVQAIPVVWTDGVYSSPIVPGYDLVRFNSISADGRTIVGTGLRAGQPELGRYPIVIRDGIPTEYSRSVDLPSVGAEIQVLSEDRSVAFGIVNNRGALWDKDGNVYDQDVLLRTWGLLPDPVYLTQIRGMSRDGRRLVGTAYQKDNHAPAFILNLESRTWPNIVNPPPYLGANYFNERFTTYVRLARPAPKGGTHVYVESPDNYLTFRKDIFIPYGKTTAPLFVKVGPAPAGVLKQSATLTLRGPENSYLHQFDVRDLAPHTEYKTRQVKGGTQIDALLVSKSLPDHEGAVFDISSSDPDVVKVPFYVALSGSLTQQFTLRTFPVTERKVVTITMKFRTFKIVDRIVVTP